MKYQKIMVKQALNKTSGKYPYHWDLNIYRGCYHACHYCYALYSHQYLGDENFFETIFIKENIIEVLEKQLQAKSWKKEVINIGSVCDSYQPIEAETMLMRDVLKLMIKYQNPIIISTKSTLILRDIDLIAELANITYVSIALTINSTSNNLNNLFESNAPTCLDRFKVLKRLKETNAQVGLHMMPLIPYLSARKENIEAMFVLANKVNVDYVIVGLLNLRSQTKQHFFTYLKDNLPEYYELIYTYYHDSKVRKEYKKRYYQYLNELIKKYHINLNYKRYDHEDKNQQLKLF